MNILSITSKSTESSSMDGRNAHFSGPSNLLVSVPQPPPCPPAPGSSLPSPVVSEVGQTSEAHDRHCCYLTDLTVPNHPGHWVTDTADKLSTSNAVMVMMTSYSMPHFLQANFSLNVNSRSPAASRQRTSPDSR